MGHVWPLIWPKAAAFPTFRLNRHVRHFVSALLNVRGYHMARDAFSINHASLAFVYYILYTLYQLLHRQYLLTILRLVSLQNQLQNMQIKFMNQIRTSLRDYRKKLDETLQVRT